MATDELAKLSVQLELQTAAFEAGVKQVDRQLKKLDENTKKSSRGIDTLNKSVKLLKKNFIALAGAVTVGALTNQTKQAIEFGDNIAKTADKVGVTTSELQELRFAAGQSGIEVRTLDMALQRFARRMGEAAQGTGELLKTAEELGIEFQDSEGRYYSTTELLNQYAEAMGKAETQQEKLRLAFKAFDSEGAALVNLLGDGSEEMEALREQAVELGLVLGEDLVRESEILNDKFEILATQVKVRVTEAFLNATQAVLEFFGVFADADSAREELSKIQDEMREIEEEWEAGNLSRIRADRLQDRYTELKAEAAELEGTIADLDATTERLAKNNEAAANSTDRQANALTRLAEGYKKALNPLIPLGEEIEKIQSAVGNGITQAEAWILITKAIEDYNKAAAEAVEKTGDVKENFDDLLKGINDSFALAENPLSDLSGLEDIGVYFGDVEDEADESLDRILQAVDGFAKDFTNTIVDGLKTGELAFDDFAKSVLETIVKMMLNDIFTEFFNIIYGGIKGYFGIGTAPTSTGDSTRGMERAGEQSTAMVGQVTGYYAPRSYNKQGAVTVNVNNYGNDDVSVTERQDSNGGIDIDVLIKQKVNSGFARGDYDKSVASAFGLRRLGY